MRRWIVGVIAVLACLVLADVQIPDASGNSARSGAAFCDSFPDTVPTSASFNGVVACQGVSYTGSIAYKGIATQSATAGSRGGSWQCTEFASRYFLTITGRSAPSGSTGANWVAQTHKSNPSYGLGGGAGTAIFSPSLVPGAIISMWGGPQADPLGHVGVVATVDVVHGDGSITVVSENIAGLSTIRVVNNVMSFGSPTDLNGRFYYTTFQWLTGLPDGARGAPYANGSLVRTPNGDVYVIAGDAPLRLQSCAYMADGNCSSAIAVRNLNGYLPTPVNGTLLHDGLTGDLYLVAGGAPVRIGSCQFTPGGWCSTAVTVDDYPISTLDHLRAIPADGTMFYDGWNGEKYVMSGGVLVSAGSCVTTSHGDCGTAVTVDDFAISTLPQTGEVRSGSFPLCGVAREWLGNICG